MKQNVVCFDNADKDHIVFSNWFEADFELDRRVFASVEQYMMYCKAQLFKDPEASEAVMKLTDAAEIKALGRKVKNYNDHLWNGYRQLVVYRGVKAKFQQNETLKEHLLSTGDAWLAECEPSDRIWGIGMDLQDERRLDPSLWQGQNLLGYTLMQVRAELNGETV